MADSPTPIRTLTLASPTWLLADGEPLPCRIGRAGLAAPGAKREGDLKTPHGRFYLRDGYWRADRLEAPAPCGLSLAPITPQMGWCDDPAHPDYNRPVTLPHPARHECLWREDGLYDVVIPLGYNDGGEGVPIQPGLGSAIFLHCMRADGVGTEGCIALPRALLIALLPRLTTATQCRTDGMHATDQARDYL